MNILKRFGIKKPTEAIENILRNNYPPFSDGRPGQKLVEDISVEYFGRKYW